MVIFAGARRDDDDLTFYPPRNATAIKEFIQKNARGMNHFIFGTKETTALIEHLASFGREHVTDSTQEGQIRTYKPGTIVKYYILLENVCRLAVSNSYVALRDHHTTELLHRYNMIKEAYNNRKAPATSRFGFFDNKAFEFSVRLEGLG
jgi:hypothetical protein